MCNLLPLYTCLYFLLLFPCNYLSSLQLQTSNTPFSRISPANTPILPKNPRQLGEILQKTPPPFFIPKSSKILLFIPQTSENPIFPLKTSQTPIFSNFWYFFIKNPGFYRHLTPAALIPYFSLISPIFQKSSNSRLFPTFSQFHDQNPTKTPFFHGNPHFFHRKALKTSIFQQPSTF